MNHEDVLLASSSIHSVYHRFAYLTTHSLTLALKASLSARKCCAASLLSGSSKLRRSPKRELSPQMTSFSLRVGAQPMPSMALRRRMLRHTSPSSLMLGCHSRVRQRTEGGLRL